MTKRTSLILGCFSLLAAAAIFLFSPLSPFMHGRTNVDETFETETTSGAGEALKLWAMSRTFPDGKFHTENYIHALEQMRLAGQWRGGGNAWQSLGPKNIGGRTLCIAVHPTDTNTIYIGTASGGFWKTTTAGKGYYAWQYIETGFPVLGISAVVIDPLQPDVIYIGTGEVYNVENAQPNVAIRETRGTYGIGILKSSDGGNTWSKSLDWGYGQLRGVQDMKINPMRPATLYAATSEGLLRSYDAGSTWQTINSTRMAVDIEIHPTDTSIIYVTHGSHNDTDVSGIYRSTNAGTTFQKLSNGLPSTFTGKALLSVCTSQPQIIFASIGNTTNQEGLYKSTNGGNTWSKISSQNVASYQGWYSHDVAVRPDNPNEVVWVGVEAFKSTDGGTTWDKKSSWFAWFFGQVPVGGPEGPSNYCHADIHRIYHLPNDPNKMYYATDGGVFVSYDGGSTFEGRNGSLQCTQFYANMGNSTTNPNICIGGMQDNSTAIYSGDDAWFRAIGGDGECAAVDPTNDQIMYGSSQYLNINRSNDGGQSFTNIAPPDNGNCFNGPFEISPLAPSTLYAGGPNLWKSTDKGDNWENVHGSLVNEGNAILTIALSDTDENLLYFSTAPKVNNNIGVFRSTDGGLTLTQMTGLPNRMCMDIAIDPIQKAVVYAVFGGFGSNHIAKSIDGGDTWFPIGTTLPDLPTNTVCIDPLNTNHIYVGNDIGVWLSRDAGNTWEIYSSEAPKSLLVMHLSVSPSNRKLRVATYGHGVWQTDLAHVPTSTSQLAQSANISLKTIPNPASTNASIHFTLPERCEITIEIRDATGRQIKAENIQPHAMELEAGQHSFPLNCNGWPAGTYYVVLESALSKQKNRKFTYNTVFIKI